MTQLSCLVINIIIIVYACAPAGWRPLNTPLFSCLFLCAWTAYLGTVLKGSFPPVGVVITYVSAVEHLRVSVCAPTFQCTVLVQRQCITDSSRSRRAAASSRVLARRRRLRHIIIAVNRSHTDSTLLRGLFRTCS